MYLTLDGGFSSLGQACEDGQAVRVKCNLQRSSQTSPASTAAMRRSGVFSLHQGQSTSD